LRTISARKSLFAAAGWKAAVARIRKTPEERRAADRFFDVAMMCLEPEVCAKGRGILI